MKGARLILIMVVVLCVSAAAFGQPVAYSPNSPVVEVPAGGSGQVPVMVSATGPSNFFVVYAQQVQGSVPAAWVVASPHAGFGLPASTLFTVNVPEGTPPGKYKSTVFSYVSGVHGGGSLVESMTLEVVVSEPPPPLCDSGPAFDLSVSGDAAIWAAMKSTQEVVIKGRVVLAEGCELDGLVSWNVDDEYDDHEPSGMVSAEDLGFEVSIPIEVFRKGSDKNGRLYKVTFEAATANGLTGESQPPVSIVITHDNSGGKK
jgi:hypothetical protein